MTIKDLILNISVQTDDKHLLGCDSCNSGLLLDYSDDVLTASAGLDLHDSISLL